MRSSVYLLCDGQLGRVNFLVFLAGVWCVEHWAINGGTPCIFCLTFLKNRECLKKIRYINLS